MQLGREALHYAKYRLGIDAARSQTTEAERASLARYAAGRSRAVEIGVFEGVSARVICNNLKPGGILYAIDPFPPGSIGVSWSLLIARNQIPSPPGILIRLTSQDAVAQIKGPLDFIFFDGDHSYEGISRDWRDWSDRVVSGGIVCLHDTLIAPNSPSRLGSHEFFDTVILDDRRFRLENQEGALSVLRRI
jgi:predicted O-methyltransferase YrrM